MFIHSKKSFRFQAAGEADYVVPAEFVGDAPDWIGKTDLFKLAGKDGSILTVGAPAVSAPGVKGKGKNVTPATSAPGDTAAGDAENDAGAK